MKSHRSLMSAAILSSLPLLGGCVEYTIETTVRPDGSGVRMEEMAIGENDELEMAPAEFRALMYATPAQGWTEREGAAGVGDTIAVLERRTEVPDLTAWSRLSNRVRITGAPPSAATESFGYVKLGDVQFRNDVQVGTGTLSDGGTSYTYRETFSWDQALDVLGEHVVRSLNRALEREYPALTDQERGEIMGIARARFWAAVDQGFLTDDTEEGRLEAEAVRTTAEQAVKILRVHYPGADEEALTQVLSAIYGAEDGGFETLFTEIVPGMNLAFNTEIQFRLNLPGRVTNSNAHDRDGTTLVWEFGPLDAMATPIEIYAESVLDGESAGPIR